MAEYAAGGHAENRLENIYESTYENTYENAHQKSDTNTKNKKCRKWSGENALLVATICAVILGTVLGFSLRPVNMQPLHIEYFSFPGTLFLNMLKASILPLIVCSMISGIASLEASVTGKLGFAALMYYMVTTVIAVILGLLLVMSIQPGRYGSNSFDGVGTVSESPTTPVDAIMDLVRNAFPDNIARSTIQNYRSERVNKTRIVAIETLPDGTTVPVEEQYLFIEGSYSWNYNILGLIVVSIAFGLALVKLKERGKNVTQWFTTFAEITNVVVGWIMWFGPVGIVFLIAGQILKMDNVAQTFQQLGMYVLTVMCGLTIHFFVILTLIFWGVTRKNPFTYMWGTFQALLTAFSTSSSSATLPITISNLEKNNHIHPQICGFVLPIGATVNMDGTALYEAVAAVFIAQYSGMDLNFGDVLVICVTATIAAIGAAGIPSGGLVTMMMVLGAIGLPEENVVLILSVDWLLDRFRTLTNVWGDTVGCAVVQHFADKHKWFDAQPNTSCIDSDLEHASEEFDREPTSKPAFPV